MQADDTVDINQTIDASNGALHLISLNAGVTDLEPATITVRDLWLSAGEEVNLANRIVAQSVTFYDIGGRTWLTNEQNQLGSVTFVRDLRAQSGEVDIVNSAEGLSLTTSNVGGITYSTDGNFRVRTSGDLTLASAFQIQVGGDVTLVAARGVLRNQSTAGAGVFGTSATGLGRTRAYAAGAGEHGGLEGPAQYNVSYSVEHETAASTGFYYSGNAPQDPGPSDPGPSDPVDPVDPPHIPETPPQPPSQIIETALGGNSFEQLNRPAQDNVSRNTMQPDSDPGALTLSAALAQQLGRLTESDPSTWSTGKLDQMERLAEQAGMGTTKQPRNPDSTESEQPRPPQVLIDQLDDLVARMTAFLQQLSSSGGSISGAQLEQQLGSISPQLMQMYTQSPTAFSQQMAIIMAQIAMERRNEASDLRAQLNQQMSQQMDQIRQAAQQL